MKIKDWIMGIKDNFYDRFQSNLKDVVYIQGKSFNETPQIVGARLRFQNGVIIRITDGSDLTINIEDVDNPDYKKIKIFMTVFFLTPHKKNLRPRKITVDGEEFRILILPDNTMCYLYPYFAWEIHNLENLTQLKDEINHYYDIFYKFVTEFNLDRVVLPENAPLNKLLTYNFNIEKNFPFEKFETFGARYESTYRETTEFNTKDKRFSNILDVGRYKGKYITTEKLYSFIFPNDGLIPYN